MINFKNKIINTSKGRVIPFGLLGYAWVKESINGDLVLTFVGGYPSTMIIKKGEYIL